MQFEKYSKPGCILPDYIEIKDSTIEGAGKGAYSTCDIPKGVTIGEYVGKVFTGKNMDKTSGYYLFDVNKGNKTIKIIDGKFKKYSSWVRFVNTPQTPSGGNAEFYQNNKRIFIRTTKPIPAGQEIFAYYGDSYVNELLKPHFKKENKPKLNVFLTGIKCNLSNINKSKKLSSSKSKRKSRSRRS
jgi:hypothetical protein